LEAFFILADMNNTTIEKLYQIYLKHPILSKDTREVSKDCIYFALQGESFNGNRFAEDALNAGAAFAVIDDVTYQKDNRYLLVDDGLKALQELANYHRKRISTPIIAISGSNGKTTTKELIAVALSQKFNTLSTVGNYNNHIGVPLTLLQIRSEHDIAIIEMGANHQGEIDFLCNIAEPNFGMLTNIGKAHLEGFGGEEGVRTGKTEMFRFINKTGGTLFINLDDQKIRESIPRNSICITYSLNNGSANGEGTLIETHPRLKGTWNYENNSGKINSSLYGAYNFHNILAACTIASYFGTNANAVTNAINSYESDMNRSQLIKKNGALIYLDAYNANPSSMSLALDNFEKVESASKITILGDMFELGETAAIEHVKIMEQIRSSKTISTAVFVGENFNNVKVEQDNFLFFSTTAEAKKWFLNQQISDFTILLKGSRGMKLESLLEK